MLDLIKTILFVLPALIHVGEDVVDQNYVWDLPVKYGENATFTVHVNESLPANYKVLWSQNNNTVEEKTDTTSTYHMVSSHGFSLMFTNMVGKLEGEYKCFIIADGIAKTLVATVLVFIRIPDATCYIYAKMLVSNDTRAALLSLPAFSQLNKPRFLQVEEDGKRICDFNSTGVSLIDTPNRKCYTNSSFTDIIIDNISKDFDLRKLTVIAYYAVEQKWRTCTCNPSAIKDGDEPQKNTNAPVVKFTTIATTAEGDKHQSKTASPTNPQVVTSAKIPEVTRKPTSHSQKSIVGNPILILILMVIGCLQTFSNT